jgi:phosphinothricin acetyltransferase
MDVRIRPAEIADLAGIVAVYNHYVLETAATFEVAAVEPKDKMAWWQEHANGGPHRLYVAIGPSGDVEGWATTSPFRPRAAYRTTVESSVYVRPAAVGHGLGSRLYATLFGAIRGEDLERIVAGIALPNPASVALHRRFGFRPVGVFTRVGRKFDRYWDVAWFERPLRLDPPDPASPTERPGTVASGG